MLHPYIFKQLTASIQFEQFSTIALKLLKSGFINKLTTRYRQGLTAVFRADVARERRLKASVTSTSRGVHWPASRPEHFNSFTHICRKSISIVKRLVVSCFSCRNLLLFSLVFGIRQLTLDDVAEVITLVKDVTTKRENHLIRKISEQAVVCKF